MNAKYLQLNWIWLPNEERGREPVFALFRKCLEIMQVSEKNEIKISADSRYKLYVNGQFITEGPAKGNEEIWYYDSIDITDFLQTGSNVIAVEVLSFPQDFAKRNHSIILSEVPGLYVEGMIGDTDISGKEGWKCVKDDTRTLKPDPWRPAPLNGMEHVEASSELHGWKSVNFDDSNWLEARPYTFFELHRGVSPMNLMKRPIPNLKHEQRQFKKAVCIREGSPIDTDARLRPWNNLLQGKESVLIPSNTKVRVEIALDDLDTGYPKLKIQKGAGAKVQMQYSECYSYPRENQGDDEHCSIKGDRLDYKNGKLFGLRDTFFPTGLGDEYVSFSNRTFRFVALDIETSADELIIEEMSYVTCCYPLEVTTAIKTSDEQMNKIWDISLRSLQLCMQETYMDCPYYEQLQYAMDARLEILYTYQVSSDDRLARQCMEALKHSQRMDGVLNSCAPNCETNVIPGFSIYYILMVYDHMMYFGDKELIKDHFGTIENILRFYERHILENGLVGNLGGPLMRHPYWSFVDWTKEWQDTTGVPPAVLKGPLTMESLFYIVGLQAAAKLMEFIGRNGLSEEYNYRADEVKKAILANCIGKDGLLQDGPGVDEYSVHTQVFAILTEVLTLEQGRHALTVTVENESYPQCSIAMNYYLFRAFEKVDMYEKTANLWNRWKEMLDKNLTTCPENDTDERSDCHGWGALPLFEMTRAKEDE